MGEGVVKRGLGASCRSRTTTNLIDLKAVTDQEMRSNHGLHDRQRGLVDDIVSLAFL